MIVGVIGAGQMGAGIAQVSAGAGHDVLLSDIDIGRAEAGDVDVGEEHVVARARRHLRDARAHLPRTDNADDHASLLCDRSLFRSS